MTKNQLFVEVSKILKESSNPGDEIKKLIDEGEFDIKPFEIIKNLQNIEQNLTHHPEGNVLNHTILVLNEANKYKHLSKDEKSFMWAALLHDLGKLTTTKVRKGKITTYGHDLQGEILAQRFLIQLTDDKNFIERVCKLVKHHMQPLFYDKKLPFFNEVDIIKESDYKEIAMLSLADRLGRGNLSLDKIKNEQERINNFSNYFTDKYQ